MSCGCGCSSVPVIGSMGLGAGSPIALRRMGNGVRRDLFGLGDTTDITDLPPIDTGAIDTGAYGPLYTDPSGGIVDANGDTVVLPSTTIPPVGTVSNSSASGSGLNLNNLVSQWTSIAGSILKSAAGANPTLVQTGPNGTSTTYYAPTGAGAGTPLPTSLQSSFASLTTSSGLPILLIGGVILLLAMKK